VLGVLPSFVVVDCWYSNQFFNNLRVKHRLFSMTEFRSIVSVSQQTPKAFFPGLTFLYCRWRKGI